MKFSGNISGVCVPMIPDAMPQCSFHIRSHVPFLISDFKKSERFILYLRLMCPKTPIALCNALCNGLVTSGFSPGLFEGALPFGMIYHPL